MKLLLLLPIIFLVSCAGLYRVDAKPGSLVKGKVVVLPADGADGDATCKRGIKDELRNRGYTLVEPVPGAPSSPDVLVRFADEWKWDMVMFLWALDIHFTDPRTGAVVGSVHYRNRFWHTFPRQTDITRRSFEALDAKGAFAR